MNFAVVYLISFAYLFYHMIESLIFALTPDQLKKKKDISGQRILITGAGNGIGRQLAFEFSKLSACLILLDIDKKSLNNTKKMLERKCNVFIYECDVSERKKVYEVADRIKKDIGDVDILVNNAGVVNGKHLMDLEDEKIVKCIEVNAVSHFWMCKAFLPSMMAKNKGHVVSIASMLGYIGAIQLSDYCASKFAVVGFSKSLDLEIREKGLDGVKLTIVNPALVSTGLFEGCKEPFLGSMKPEYAARVIVEGVLRNEETIFLPPFLHWMRIFEAISPRWLTFHMHKLMGSAYMMKNFTGRKSN